MIFSKRMELAKRVDKYIEEKRILKDTQSVITVLEIFEYLKDEPGEGGIKTASVKG